MRNDRTVKNDNSVSYRTSSGISDSSSYRSSVGNSYRSSYRNAYSSGNRSSDISSIRSSNISFNRKSNISTNRSSNRSAYRNAYRNAYRRDLRKVYLRSHSAGSNAITVSTASGYSRDDSRRSFIRFLIMASVLTAVLMFLLSSRANAVEKTDTVYYKYFTNIRVEAGETLCSIADRYNEPDVRSDSDYMDEVCKINNIRPDNIEAGDYIVIPYYSPDYK